jgi:hypothetical protein
MRDHGVSIDAGHGVDTRNDLDGLAALLTACDLVLTVNNATAHLAAALGRPTWIMLPRYILPFWNSFQDAPEGPGQRSPWYPSVRLFRRGQNEPYPNDQIERLRTALRQWTSRSWELDSPGKSDLA